MEPPASIAPGARLKLLARRLSVASLRTLHEAVDEPAARARPLPAPALDALAREPEPLLGLTPLPRLPIELLRHHDLVAGECNPTVGQHDPQQHMPGPAER